MLTPQTVQLVSWTRMKAGIQFPGSFLGTTVRHPKAFAMLQWGTRRVHASADAG